MHDASARLREALQRRCASTRRVNLPTILLLALSSALGACANTTETRSEVVVARAPIKLPPRREDWTLRAKHAVEDGVLAMTVTVAESCEEVGERVTVEARTETQPSGAMLVVDVLALAGSFALLKAYPTCDSFLCFEHAAATPLLLLSTGATLGDLTKFHKRTTRRTEDRRTLAAAPVCKETPFAPPTLLVSFDDAPAMAVQPDGAGAYRLRWPTPPPHRVTLSVPGAPLRGGFER